MDLAEYLTANKLTLDAFGKKVGLSHSQLSRIVRGKSGTTLETALRIEAETGGAVQPRDLPQVEAA